MFLVESERGGAAVESVGFDEVKFRGVFFGSGLRWRRAWGSHFGSFRDVVVDWFVWKMIGRGLRGSVSFVLRWRGAWGYHYDSVDIAGEDLFVVGDGRRMIRGREVYVLRDANREVEAKSIHLMGCAVDKGNSLSAEVIVSNAGGENILCSHRSVLSIKIIHWSCLSALQPLESPSSPS
jgi:hypothetical protein